MHLTLKYLSVHTSINIAKPKKKSLNKLITIKEGIVSKEKAETTNSTILNRTPTPLIILFIA